MALKTFKTSYNEIVKSNKGRANKIIVNFSNNLKNNKFKNLIYMLNIKAIKKSIFLTFNAKKFFNYLRQTFIKTLILQLFDLKWYI